MGRYGFAVVKPRGGSHWVVYHRVQGDLPQETIPVHRNRVKPVYVRRLARLLEKVLNTEDEEHAHKP